MNHVPYEEKSGWTVDRARAIFSQPFFDLLFQAQQVHRSSFPAHEIQVSTLLSIKTGGCPENCSYCPQSAAYQTGIQKEPLMALGTVLEAAQRAKDAGSTRFCLGAAWRGPTNAALEKVCVMVQEIKKLGLETCATLGLLTSEQAERLKEAGLDYYNHNIDTSPDFYEQIISTRTFQDRLETLGYVRQAGLKTCCGGIIGMGETNEDRLKMLVVLSEMGPAPESVPINKLIPIPGTPLAQEGKIESFDFVRVIATARIMMPHSFLRLSAGRESMSSELQALCFLAGVNSIFYGEKLLTRENPVPEEDDRLFQMLGLRKMA